MLARTINSHNDMQSSCHNVGTMLSLQQQSVSDKKNEGKQRKNSRTSQRKTKKHENMTCLSSTVDDYL